MEETTFVYMNLSGYAVVVNPPFGGTLVIPANKAVKGEYFARFALPAGSLTMVNEATVPPASIVFETKPLNDLVAARWDKTKKQTDPILGEVPVELRPAVETVVEIEEEAEPEPAAEEPAVVEEEAAPAPKRGRKKKQQ
jgi:hypothetical protein